MKAILQLAILPLALTGLLSVELLEWAPPADDSVGIDPHPRPGSIPAIPGRPAVGPDALAAIVLARPLMDPGRRPLAGPAVQGDAPPGEGSGLPRLSGVIIAPEGNRGIFSPAAGKPLILAEGDRIGRYTIKTISPNLVILSGSEGEQLLRPKRQDTVASVVPPAVPSAGASSIRRRPGTGK